MDLLSIIFSVFILGVPLVCGACILLIKGSYKSNTRYMPTSFAVGDDGHAAHTLPIFSHLPPEIRDLVYSFAMHHLPTRCIILPSKPMSKLVVYPQTLPALCFTSKQLHRHGLHVWLRRTRFAVFHGQRNSQQLMDFLNLVDGFKHVRMLSVLGLGHFKYPYSLHGVSDLVAACTGLKKLSIEIMATSLIKIGNIGSVSFPGVSLESPKVLREGLYLQCLFNLKSLEHLIISTNIDKDVVYTLMQIGNIRPEDSMNNLRVAVREGFDDVGKKDKVMVEYIRPF